MRILTYLPILCACLFLMGCKKDKTDKVKDKPTIEVPTTDNNATVEQEEIPANEAFQLNDYFETFIAKNNTNGDIVNVDKPKMGGELSKKADKVKLEVRGYWVNENANGKSKLTLEIYPNSFKQGDGNRPFIEQKLNLTAENKYLLFGYLKNVSLEEGLYYYFLKNGDDIVYTGKFVAK